MKRSLFATVLLCLIFPPAVFAHPTARFIRNHTTIRVHAEYQLGHKVWVCSWRPGDTRVRPLVTYSRRSPRTVEAWAGAGRRRSRTVCAMNGGTYTWRTYYPSGALFAEGRRIHPASDAPAVGFTRNGRVWFGARNARRHGSVNIVNGMAFLIQRGRPLLSHARAPWTTPAQFSCGARGTDSWYGCFRSTIVSFRNGRVGLVEIALASMPTASRILMRMGVRDAITLDAGGAARLWTLAGRHNTGRYRVGHTFGTIPPGYPWHRLIPDAVLINARRA